VLVVAVMAAATASYCTPGGESETGGEAETATTRIEGSPGPRSDTAPTYRVRFRVEAVKGKAPSGKSFSFHFIRNENASDEAPYAPPVNARDNRWSPWLTFERSQFDYLRTRSPNNAYTPDIVMAKIRVHGVEDSTRLRGEIRLDETASVSAFRAELIGPKLGILSWREADGTPRAGTLADYNQRFWRVIEGAKPLSEDERPEKFTIADLFLHTDDDLRAWREGLQRMGMLGVNTMNVPSDRIRRLAEEHGITRAQVPIYSPPGYTFNFHSCAGCGGANGNYQPDAAGLEKWAADHVAAVRTKGYKPSDVGLINMADEPLWFYDFNKESDLEAFGWLAKNGAALARYRTYLQDHGVTLADTGQSAWEQVQPVYRSAAASPGGRKHYYWTMRFFAEEATRHYAASVSALERAFYPDVPIATNFVNVLGHSVLSQINGAPPVDPAKPNTGAGSFDWLEFGRLRAGTAMFSELWLPDGDAYQASHFAARFRSAAAKSGIGSGAYIAGLTSGDRPGGLLQKALALVGNGSKSLFYWAFGPHYNVPANGYAETMEKKPQVAADIVHANRLIARSEDLLYPGKPAPSKVALVFPRSAQVWDPLAKSSGAPEVLQWDYMTEVYELYLALQHANIPADFIEEEDLTARGLADYKVVYLPTQAVPVEGQEALASWVNGGGTLVTVANAGSRDRYNSPVRTLSAFTGITEAPRDPSHIEYLWTSTPEVGPATTTAAGGTAKAWVARSTVTEVAGTAEATFADGAPAILNVPKGAGRVVHFSFLPGASYMHSAVDPYVHRAGDHGKPPTGFSADLRRWITRPVELAGVTAPVEVSQPLVETPVLTSAEGAVLTMLNWTGGPVSNLTVRYRAPFSATTKVTSAERGDLPFQRTPDGITFTLPSLADADIVRVYGR
jgi:hypothetical protein